MSPKLYENHTIVTDNWKKGMGKALRVILLMLIIVSSFATMIIGFLIWLITLGHLHLYRLGVSAWESDESGNFYLLGMNVTKVIPDDWNE